MGLINALLNLFERVNIIYLEGCNTGFGQKTTWLRSNTRELGSKSSSTEIEIVQNRSILDRIIAFRHLPRLKMFEDGV